MADDQPSGPATAEPKGEKETIKDAEKVLIRRSPKQTEISITDTRHVSGTEGADDLAARAGAVSPPKPTGDTGAPPQAEQPPAPRPPHPSQASQPAESPQMATEPKSATQNLQGEQPPSRSSGADQPSTTKGQPTGSSAKGVTDSPEATVRRAEQGQSIWRQRLNERIAGFFQRRQASSLASEGGKKLLARLAANPVFWEWMAIILVAIVTIVAVVMAIYLITCTYQGTCTGTDGTTRNANVGSDRDAILINLAKQGDQSAKLQYMRDHQQEVILTLGQQKTLEPNDTNKVVIDKLIKAIGELKPGTNYSDSNLSDPGKQEKRAALDAYAAYQKIGGAAPEVRKYMNLANAQGAQLSFVGDTFLAGRGSDLHNGYDMYGPAGSVVIAGWDGVVEATNFAYTRPGISVEAYGYGMTVLSTVDGVKYRIFYGHINNNQPVKAGDTITAGQKLGTIYPTAHPHLDMKWKRLKPDGSDDVFVDFGRAPFRSAAEIERSLKEVK